MGGDVNGVTEYGAGPLSFIADHAGDGGTGVDPGTKPRPRLVIGCHAASGVLEIERSPCSPRGVFGLVYGDVECHHYRVADEAINSSAGGADGRKDGVALK
jgi:hypothetical protein